MRIDPGLHVLIVNPSRTSCRNSYGDRFPSRGHWEIQMRRLLRVLWGNGNRFESKSGSKKNRKRRKTKSEETGQLIPPGIPYYSAAGVPGGIGQYLPPGHEIVNARGLRQTMNALLDNHALKVTLTLSRQVWPSQGNSHRLGFPGFYYYYY